MRIYYRATPLDGSLCPFIFNLGAHCSADQLTRTLGQGPNGTTQEQGGTEGIYINRSAWFDKNHTLISSFTYIIILTHQDLGTIRQNAF